MQIRRNKNISIFLTAVVIFVSVVGVGIVYAPMLFGLKAFSIETGSMEPVISQGSMVYVKPISKFEDYKVNDVVTFTNPKTSQSFTHRIVQIDASGGQFITKGDANDEPDMAPTHVSLAVGTVQFAIPLLGYVAMFLRSTVVKIAVAVIYIAWAAIEIELYLAERKKRYE